MNHQAEKKVFHRKTSTVHLGSFSLPKIMVIGLLLALNSLVSAPQLFAQNIEDKIIASKKNHRNLYFKHFSTADGLSDNSVNCVLEDENGFIWVGTSQGLNRFDRYDWIHFFKDGPMNAVCGNDIRVLNPSLEGGFWVGTADGGLCRYCDKENRFVDYKFDHIAEPGVIEIMAITAHPHWGTYVSIYQEGIYKLNESTETFEPNDFIDNHLQRRYYSLLSTDSGMYSGPLGFALLANFESRLECYNTGQIGTSPYPGHTLSFLYHNGESKVWAGAWDNGLYNFCEEEKKFSLVTTLNHQALSHNQDEITSIASTGDILWLGTKRSGLFQYHTKQDFFVNHRHEFLDKNSISSNTINHLYRDKSDNIWVSTDQGLNLYHPDLNRFNLFYLSGDIQQTDFSEPVQSISANSEMAFFVSRNNIFQCKIEGWNCEKIPHTLGTDEFIYTVLLTDSNELLIGTNKTAYSSSPPYTELQTFKAVYNKIHPHTKARVNFDFFDLFSSRITSIQNFKLQEKEVYVFYSYGHGITIISTESRSGFSSYPYTDAHTLGLLNDVFIDARGQMWLLNEKTGIWGDFQLLEANGEFVKESLSNSDNCQGVCFKETGEPPLLNFAKIYKHSQGTTNPIKMTEFAQDSFFVIMGGKGLALFTPDGEEFFKGFPSPNQNFQDLIIDRKERVWLSSANGLSVYDPSNNSWHHIANSNGLPEKGLSGNLQLLDDGGVLAGSFGSMVHFKPENFTFEEDPPRVAITHFLIFGERADHLLAGNPSIQLSYSENFFTFEFTSFNFHSSPNVTYFYKLEGLHNEWVNAGRNRSATFTNLSGGEYTFKVKSINASGQESAIKSVQLSIIPPFYLRNWFFVVMGLSIISGSYILYRQRIRNLNRLQRMRLSTEIEAKEQERQRLARDLHDELGTRLSAIKLYLGSIEKFLSPNPEADEIKKQASELLDESVRDLRNMLLNLSPQTVQRYGYYSALEDLTAKIDATKQIRVSLNRTGSNVRLQTSIELGVYRIVQELINNSLKHSACSFIDINIIQKPNRLTIFFEDDGKGMDLIGVKSGYGLKNIENRLSLIDGSVEWDSTPGEGLRAIVTINLEEKS
ncbi:MAG: hypothetical protein EA409_03305 [Saprospirales bacterium]|nr:MAG: hypothetical protein EA409_03305 [Saprospirales bacterium]